MECKTLPPPQRITKSRVKDLIKHRAASFLPFDVDDERHKAVLGYRGGTYIRNKRDGHYYLFEMHPLIKKYAASAGS